MITADRSGQTDGAVANWLLSSGFRLKFKKNRDTGPGRRQVAA